MLYIMKWLKNVKESHYLVNEFRGKKLMIAINLFKNSHTKEQSTTEIKKVNKLIRKKSVKSLPIINYEELEILKVFYQETSKIKEVI